MLRAAFELTLAILTGAAACWGAVALIVVYDWLAFGWPHIEAEAATTFPSFVPRPLASTPPAQVASVRRLGSVAAPTARASTQHARLRA